MTSPSVIPFEPRPIGANWIGELPRALIDYTPEIEFPHTWRLPPIHQRRPTRKRKPPRLAIPTYSIFAIGAAATGSGTLNPAVPAGTLTGTLMLLCVSGNTSSNTITTPSGYVVVKQGSVNCCAIFGKIGTSSESAPSVVFSNANAHCAFIVALTSSTGWPVIGSVLIDSSAGNNTGVSTQRYGSLAVTEEGLCGFQFAAKNQSNTGATDVTVTSGYTYAGKAIRDVAASGLVISAQLFNGSPTVATGLIQNDETVTGNPSEAANQRRISLTLKGVADTSFDFDASSRAVSQHNALPDALLDAMVANGNTGAFESGDEYEEFGDPIPSDADYTLADFGVVEIFFDDPDPEPVEIGFVFHDANGTGDGLYFYRLRFHPPDADGPILSNVSAVLVASTAITIGATLTDERPPIGFYVVAIPAGDNPPSDDQIIAGDNANNEPAISGSASIAANGTTSVDLLGLTADTDYEFHCVGEDDVGNKSLITIVAQKTAGSGYPAATTVPRKTKVVPVVNVEIALMDDGTLRASDVTATRAYSITIEHEWITIAERDVVDDFVENQLYQLVDIEAADGYTYRCLLTHGFEWETASATRVHGSITLKGNRVE